MKNNIFTKLWGAADYQRFSSNGMGSGIYDRYSLIEGVDIAKLQQAHVTMIGAGGLGSEVGYGLVRKGVGGLCLIDHDIVEPSNLQRQFFMQDDVGKYKAMALARNLISHATGTTQITAFAHPFQSVVTDPRFRAGDVIVVGVDNNPTRIAVAEYCVRFRIPAVFVAVDEQASKGHVFVQGSRDDAACFLCFDPNAPDDNRIFECAGSSIDINMSICGVALYALDSLLMSRKRSWNVKEIFFNATDSARIIAKRRRCSLCGGLSKP